MPDGRQVAAALEYLEHEVFEVAEAPRGALEDVDVVVDGLGEAVADAMDEEVQQAVAPAVELLAEPGEGGELTLAGATDPDWRVQLGAKCLCLKSWLIASSRDYS